MLQWLDDLPNKTQEEKKRAPKYPFNLLAGERRSYNANAIMRNPEWRKKDVVGLLKINPEDAQEYAIADGDWVKCVSSIGSVKIKTFITDEIPKGMLSMPHGYGFDYPDQSEEAIGALANLLTSLEDCDPLAKTPYHKNVRVRIEKIDDPAKISV